MKPTKDYEVMLFKAERDYKSGIILLENEIEEGAIYHFQQCAEKSKNYLKAFNKCLDNMTEKDLEIMTNYVLSKFSKKG